MSPRTIPCLFLALLISPAFIRAEDDKTIHREESLAEARERTEVLARRMDDLSAEAQDIIWNYTNEKLTSFLKEIDDAMLDARDLLEEYDTGGKTIAAEQDVLEKIYEAAKKAASQSSQQQGEEGEKPEQGEGEGEGEGKGKGQGKGDGGMQAMLRMMENMLGITPTEEPGDGKGSGGNQPGQGGMGPGNGDSSALRGAAREAMKEARTVPRAAGNPGGLAPPEYRDQLESFYRAMDSLDADQNHP